MFKKILIANRGEIACRVIKTARRMGIATVAVYSDADARAPFVRMADEAVHIGPSPASESYLIADKIIEACKATGAEAVHPGYGFLSERTSFAEALAKENIAFIGPPVNAIAAMGDKIESKKLAKEAGVNVVPGFVGEIRDTEHAVEISNEIGYPVMMKASAGGGGKGMRLAYDEKDVREGFESVKREGLNSFGDDRVFIEKFILNPRHIEIQILGDQHGNILYLNERECSIQRRHQKVVEEAPSPFVTPKMRKAMGEQCVALSKAVGYYSAGTVELIVSGADPTGESFYFLEMNTRLQVEHPVTEAITGIDLVEQMIRVAAGEKLELTQDDIKIDGWAIENRVYAEDPYRGFLPSTGRLVRYSPPPASRHQAPFASSEVEMPIGRARLPGVSTSLDTNGDEKAGYIRVDDGVAEGGEVSIFYDPMIAKLITWGKTRDEAADLQVAALDRFELEGLGHNIDFVSAIMQHPRFRSGELTTGFIAEEYPDGFHGAPADEAVTRALAAIAGFMASAEADRARRVDGQLGDRLDPPAKWQVTIGDASHKVKLGRKHIKVDGEKVDIALEYTPGDRLVVAEIDGSELAVKVAKTRTGWRMTTRGAIHDVRVLPWHVAPLSAHMIEKVPPDLSKFLICPMPGLLVALHVGAGDKVEAGQPLATVEAMKMENILRAEKTGVVKSVNAAQGDSLAVDAVILELE
ncbi:acetyl-CoA carboxylase biotin carboxylase subunit [Sphingopyxis granuli]|uniref:acetyl-CoA carboxylase biotin carboxylase subunit n=1 Tax=Sphingopyxis granuli TaxID=267128 RepID=UPI001BAF2AC9|nr:acetyl/propionyl/methylcrotonyl-CoA carboxylase subunit alpha [Sphingopyxis granuli]QUM70970.1 acetyl/propionyl/methylcrotonyl-CoA carboxylase subunit alpha [Sphingopyxis granuli]